MQSLCLDIEVLDADGNPVELKDDEDAMDTFNLARMDADSERQNRRYDAAEFQNAGFDVQDAPSDAGADIGVTDDDYTSDDADTDDYSGADADADFAEASDGGDFDLSDAFGSEDSAFRAASDEADLF